jgi:hypothetical protein
MRKDTVFNVILNVFIIKEFPLKLRDEKYIDLIGSEVKDKFTKFLLKVF